MVRDKLKLFIFAILPVIIVLGLIPTIAAWKDVADARGIAMQGTFSVEPAVFEYKVSGLKRFDIILTNLSTQASQFDMGDGDIVTTPGMGSLEYSYNVLLDGSIRRLYIQRLPTELSTDDMKFCEGIVIRIEPEKKGGET